jgi:hypothetical protein
MIRRCATLLMLLAACLLAQGLTTTATKDDWEEINFEFNYSILTDGYPSLLRLAELLQKNPTYKVKVEGHADQIGSHPYNDKLAQARANAVKEFLVRYGARASQVDAVGFGKRQLKVDNMAPPSRFMNRRAVLTVTDGQGRVVGAGGIGDAIRAIEGAQMKDCCSEVLKKLDKLDEIVGLLKDLKAENQKLRDEMAALRNAQAGLKGDVEKLAQAPPRPAEPPPAPAAPPRAIEQVAREAAKEAVKEAKAAEPGGKKFSLLGMNIGPDMTGNVTFTGKGRFFAPFNSSHAVQAEGEYLYYRDRQEGQFDIGLVNRYKNFQAGLFSSFKYANLREYQQGGTLGQGAVTLDYLFSRGRVGAFGTKGFLDNKVLGRRVLGPNIFEESYLKIVDQIGGSTQIGLRGDSYIEGNLGALFRRGGSNRPGGMVRFVQPINSLWAFTVEAGLNETLLGQNDSGRVVFGIQLGNWVRPKQFRELTHPAPVDIPRVRYEVLKRRVRTGNDAPVADAGADQTVRPGTVVTLDGSGSFDPDGDPITFEWTQIGGPAVALTGRNTARATFTAGENQNYAFRLTVRDDHGGQGIDRVAVIALANDRVRITRFTATPTRIRAGESVTLVWEIVNATEAEISGLGRVDPRNGTSTVAPDQTTTYRLTARNPNSEVSETVTVVVDRPEPRILRFQATPVTINAGQASTLGWETENADTVTITGIGNVSRSGSTTVSPTATTTFTLTARNRFGEVSSTVTITVAPIQMPRIIRFAANPIEILMGEQSNLLWQVENATDVTISGIGRVEPLGSSAVSPADTTTYTITARNSAGEVSATAVVTVVKPVKILNFAAEPTVTAFRGDPVVLRWTTENATEVVITNVGAVPLNGTVTVNPTQDTTYTLIAYGKRSTAEAFVLVRVGPPRPPSNRPPVANAGPDIETNNSLVVPLDGTRSFDPDGDPLTFSWRSLTPFPTEIYGGSSATPQVRLPGNGTFIFELTVTDPGGLTSRDTVQVTVQLRHP